MSLTNNLFVEKIHLNFQSEFLLKQQKQRRFQLPNHELTKTDEIVPELVTIESSDSENEFSIGSAEDSDIETTDEFSIEYRVSV